MLHLTAKNFELETKHGQLPVIVMFYASWCGKCAMMKPVFEDIEKKYTGKIKFGEVDIEESEALSAQYKADIVPTFIFFQDKSVAGVLQGIIDQEVFETRMEKILEFH